MYSRTFKSLNDNNSMYFLRFSSRQKYSTTYALISPTEDIRKNLDEGNIGCGIFVDLQKALGTVEHDILLAKLELYGIRGSANEWFKSYLSNTKQYVSINCHESSLASALHGVLQGSVPGPLLFLTYIKYHQAITFCTVHHFADDTNLLHFNKSAGKLKWRKLN